MAWYSPLFATASREILKAAQQSVAATSAGKAFRQMQTAAGGPGRAVGNVRSALDRYASQGPAAALRELRGTRFGQFSREVHRYAAGDAGMQRLLNQFLTELGPAGKLVQSLVGTQGKSELSQFTGLLQAMGHEVLPPRSTWKRGDPETERALAAAGEMIESMGGRVSYPGDQGTPWEAPRRLPFGIPIKDGTGRQRSQVPLTMAEGPPRGFALNHPIVTGEMVKAHRSSNVHSFGYDIESTYLYVRFLGTLQGTLGPDGPLRAGPGSLYRYRNVTPEEFLSLYAASSKGDWVWDNLRVRGTWSGHKKDYELVGVEGGYVPRKATVRRDPTTNELQEWFIKRRVRGTDGNWLTSSMPTELAGELPWGEVDRGQPDRGFPDRGEPDRG